MAPLIKKRKRRWGKLTLLKGNLLEVVVLAELEGEVDLLLLLLRVLIGEVVIAKVKLPLFADMPQNLLHHPLLVHLHHGVFPVWELHTKQWDTHVVRKGEIREGVAGNFSKKRDI